MLKKSLTLFISGWGFRADLIKESSCYCSDFTLIDLPHLNELTLDLIVKRLVMNITNGSIIIGWSLGGLIAIKLASLFPKKVRKLILLSSSPRFAKDKGWKGIRKNEAIKFLNLAKNNITCLFDYFLFLVNYPNTTVYYKTLLIKHSIDWQANKSYLIKYLEILFSIDIRELYRSIEIPILYLIGEKDAIVQLNAEKLMRLNNRTKIYSISKGGHMIFISHEAECREQLTQFINDDE
ncbi:alpha/beta fold hydrolase [Coxiella endosymbiont of Amblyomma nuttalli]|uniref:alpha/beta fold hydrolase n=1 Tax=Coxiella endosymbiont of Amblyomma nuttalli TaxID=2749996 RepID=UPI001BADC395|nr:alpha/beta fold hydrolase [Coxiella endosymbiont of Amblyomma nuttalli]QTS83920.1 Pimeloyl-[acyl-carrier protein] methyl ester esterase [Coxiella endosymbiont of Amblyomma nuttalli]